MLKHTIKLKSFNTVKRRESFYKHSKAH